MLKTELYWSIAYQVLTKAAQNLMWCFYSEARFTGKKRKKQHEYTNNGYISFSEKEFKYNKLGASQTYLNARNQLIEVGFIKLKYRGGMARGDLNQYRLLYLDEGVHINDMRWKRYPEENWKHEIPKAKGNKVGVHTRFKKGKYTLKEHTLSLVNDPTELETI